MNWIHRRLCRSASWARAVEDQLLPWALHGVDLGADVLEIGPGFGVTTAVLARRTGRLTALEVDPAMVSYLDGRFADPVRVVHGDGARMPLPDNEFSAAVCFTMLHHVPSPQLQDRLFAEAFRVVRPGGVFAGMDSLPSLRWRVIHLGDTCVPVDPRTLPDRLRAAGFTDVEVRAAAHRFRFQARRAQ
ncbi:MAG TPA: class I SAM-dependent methyltransferase [Actinophytocola sp.]|uniref:class I SAM-dependent methyltransferase n=1 Tax=Actinophytocola sp. TaxID=1872138 RepID=UPI002DDD4D4B|nr:class I SAM-dependent methyltransferase [Actinophytocola sp.]HEV2782058.1 class I SAM-dependent methyltransferase [Actinophytocola sp.]